MEKGEQDLWQLWSDLNLNYPLAVPPPLFLRWCSEATLAIWSEGLVKGPYQKNTWPTVRPEPDSEAGTCIFIDCKSGLSPTELSQPHSEGCFVYLGLMWGADTHNGSLHDPLYIDYLPINADSVSHLYRPCLASGSMVTTEWTLRLPMSAMYSTPSGVTVKEVGLLRRACEMKTVDLTATGVESME